MRKRVEGLTSPEEQSQLHLGQMAQKRRSDSCDGAGQEGRFAPGLGHIEDSGGSSPAVTPCIRQGEPRGGWRPSRGLWPLGGYTDCLRPALPSRPGAGQRECGNRAKGEEGWFCGTKCCCVESKPGPASSCWWTGGWKERRDVERSPFCSQPALLPSHRGLSH